MKNNTVLYLFGIVLVLSAAGCASTTMQTYHAAGNSTICSQSNNMGKVVVLPEVAWRADQKEPAERQKMALQEIERAFQQLPCGKLVSPDGIKPFSDWSSHSESFLLEQFSRENADTIILLRMEELTPRLMITFSLPFLWSSTSEADFRVRALSVPSGKVLADFRVKHSTGGPFNARPAKWSGDELQAALQKIIQIEK